MLKIFLALLVVQFCTSQQIPSIPTKPMGISVGSSTPKLHIEGFLDLASPVSSESFTVLWQVLQNYKISQNSDLRFTFYVWPQPAYSFSFLLATGARYIANNCKDSADLWNYFHLIFDNRKSFNNSATLNSTFNQVKLQLATLISQNMTQYTLQNAQIGLANSTNADEADDYGAFGRFWGVVTGPTYFANGIIIDAGDELTVSSWTSFISPFLSQTVIKE